METREIAAAIFSRLEDDDIINMCARESQEEIRQDAIEIIKLILDDYIIIQGKIVEN